MINGMVDSLEAKPASKNNEQITSANTASASDVVALRPITEMNWMGSIGCGRRIVNHKNLPHKIFLCVSAKLRAVCGRLHCI